DADVPRAGERAAGAGGEAAGGGGVEEESAEAGVAVELGHAGRRASEVGLQQAALHHGRPRNGGGAGNNRRGPETNRACARPGGASRKRMGRGEVERGAGGDSEGAAVGAATMAEPAQTQGPRADLDRAAVDEPRGQEGAAGAAGLTQRSQVLQQGSEGIAI